MQLSLTLLFLVILLLISLSAFFSAAEIGMMSLNRYRLRHLAKQNNKQAIRVVQMLSRPDRVLGIILIGNTLTNIIASMVATLIGQRLYGDGGVVIATLLLTFVILIFAELTPKTLAALFPQTVAFTCSLPLKVLQTLLSPIIKSASWMANSILRLLGFSVTHAQREALSREELRSMVHEATGLLPVEHKSMLISLLDLEQATIEDIIVPKADIVGIDLEQPWHELLEQLETAQHTRLPLYRHSIENLVGIVHLRDVLNLALEEELNLENLLKIADSPYFIPEGTPLNTQLLNFRKMKRRSCFVVDEYGDLLGLATMEDILEEVVGEFTTDIAALSKNIIPEDGGHVLIDASVTLRHLKQVLNWSLPVMGPRTLSGLIIEYLGYIPPSNCCLQIGSYQIEILKVGDNKIKTVRMGKTNKKKLTV